MKKAKDYDSKTLRDIVIVNPDTAKPDPKGQAAFDKKGSDRMKGGIKLFGQKKPGP